MVPLNMMHFLALMCCQGVVTLAYNKAQYPSIEAETRLMHQLFKDYDARVRPVQKPKDTVHSSFGISLKSLLHLNEQEEFMESVSYMLTAWHDGRLVWNASNYFGIDSIKVPAKDIWRPDFLPYTSIDENVHLMDTMAVIIASGHVRWIPTLYLRSPCSVNVRKFPFDTQVCTIKFASYVYHGNHLNLTYWGGTADTSLETKDYVTNKNWNLIGHKVVINVIKHKCCKEPYPHMQVDLTFSRNPSYMVHLLLLPAILLGMLVPVSLLIPPESRERVTLGAIIVLSVLLMQTKLSEILPLAHSQLPMISIYYSMVLLWAVLTLLCSTFVINLHNQGPRKGKMPDFVRWIFLRNLRRLVCVGSDNYYPLADMDAISMRGLDKPCPQDRLGHSATTTGEEREGTTSTLERHLEDVNHQLNFFISKMSMQDVRRDIENEWYQLALIVDRILFFIFLLIFFMCSITLLA